MRWNSGTKQFTLTSQWLKLVINYKIYFFIKKKAPLLSEWKRFVSLIYWSKIWRGHRFVSDWLIRWVWARSLGLQPHKTAKAYGLCWAFHLLLSSDIWAAWRYQEAPVERFCRWQSGLNPQRSFGLKDKKAKQ